MVASKQKKSKLEALDAHKTNLVVHDLLGLDLDVHSLTTGTSERLVDHDARVGHRVALALGTCNAEHTPTHMRMQQRPLTTTDACTTHRKLLPKGGWLAC